jgi:mitogen-activated protein kinase kinase kinase
VELRLNGAATPPSEDVPSASPGLDGLYTRDNHPSSGLRRLGTSRPPPLDLHSPQSRTGLPMAYQNVPTSIDSKSTTPRAGTKDGNPEPPPGPSRNTSSTSTASTVTVVPASAQVSSVPAPAPPPARQLAATNHLNLRAPPSRDPGRRSPSPVNTDPTQFIDRPLPPAPHHNQSSAAEYASSIRYAEGRSTPTWGPSSEQLALSRSQGPSSERRHHPPPIIVRPDTAHRKVPSLGAVPNRTYLAVNPKAATGPRSGTSGGPAVHPFAANRTIHENEHRGPSPESAPGSSTHPVPPPMLIHPSNGSSGSNRSNPNRNAGYMVGTGGSVPIHRSASTTINSPHGSTGRRDTSGSGSGTLSLEDLRKQLVKFINSEDGTTRTVNVSSCTSGVEVLERALKKFGKWGTGTAATTDTESDEDGDQLEIDGWGVYEELEYHEDCKCICTKLC